MHTLAECTYGLGGEIDFWSASLLESTLDRADPAEEAGQIVLDLSGIEFMDHHGVKALAEYAERRGAHMMLTKTPEHVGKLVDILDVTRLTVVDS